VKAIVYERYGPPDVLDLKEIAKPTPKDDEVLIEVYATTVTSGDARMRALRVPAGMELFARLSLGVFGPRRQILGFELSGVVSAIGKSVTRFEVGDPVFGTPGLGLGCYAEYRAMPEGGVLARKPENLTFEQAAAMCFGGTTALDFFRRGKLQSGERLLVNGASGSVGTAAIQLAKHFGAHVTGVCSTENLELVLSLGADAVIDYKREDFTRNGETYDLIMDTAGTASFSRVKGSLNKGGRLLIVTGRVSDMLAAPWVNATTDKRIVADMAGEKAEDVRLLAELAKTGKYVPAIDRTFPLKRIAEAHAYVDEGHKKGNVVITVGGGSAT